MFSRVSRLYTSFSRAIYVYRKSPEDDKIIIKANQLYHDGQYSEALIEYKKIALNHHETGAQIKVGFILFNGLHKRKKEADIDEAIKYYKKAGASNKDAQLRLGKYYLEQAQKINAVGEEKDEKHSTANQEEKFAFFLKEAKSWLKMASSQGDREASLLLNLCHSEAREREFDRQRKPEDEQILQHANELFAEGSYSESLKEYKKIAGNKYEIAAKLKAGFILYYGIGDVEQNIDAAIAYYKEVNNGEAQVRLGIHYLTVGENIEAQNWFKKAVAQGSRKAVLLLARCHFEHGTKNKLDVLNDYDAFTYIEGDVEKHKELTTDKSFNHYMRALCRLLVIAYYRTNEDDASEVKGTEAEQIFCAALTQMNSLENDKKFHARLWLGIVQVYGTSYGNLLLNHTKAYSYLEGTIKAFDSVEYIADPAKYLYAKFFSIFLGSKLGKLSAAEMKDELTQLAQRKYASPIDDVTLLPMGDIELYIPVSISIVLRMPGPQSVLRQSLSEFNESYTHYTSRCEQWRV